MLLPHFLKGGKGGFAFQHHPVNFLYHCISFLQNLKIVKTQHPQAKPSQVFVPFGIFSVMFVRRARDGGMRVRLCSSMVNPSKANPPKSPFLKGDLQPYASCYIVSSPIFFNAALNFSSNVTITVPFVAFPVAAVSASPKSPIFEGHRESSTLKSVC